MTDDLAERVRASAVATERAANAALEASTCYWLRRPRRAWLPSKKRSLAVGDDRQQAFEEACYEVIAAALVVQQTPLDHVAVEGMNVRAKRMREAASRRP